MAETESNPELDLDRVAELVPVIRDRLLHIRERVESVGGTVGGAGVDGVQVMAVTKGHPPEVAAAALEVGAHLLGESYAQELVRKAPLIPGAAWHFIGQLQSNKVRVVAPLVRVVESVDRASLVRELARRSPGHEVFIEVDLARSAGLAVAGRGGVELDRVDELIDVATGAGLVVSGVMGVAPYSAMQPLGPAAIGRAFGLLRSIVDRRSLRHCSMGMSDDLELAVAEGSTMIRVGTALVGPRTVQAG